MINQTEILTSETDRVNAAASQPIGGLDRRLDAFRPIALHEMLGASLLRRISSKYLMTPGQLLRILDGLSQDYRILEIAGRRLHHYETRYFDTPDLACYRQHHNGWRSRYKIRSRAYLDTDQAFLEVKCKDTAGVTTKSRLRTSRAIVSLGRQANDFVAAHAPLPTAALRPTVWNTFRRITLVGIDTVERVTIDVGVTLGRGDACITLPNVAVAEIKQEHPSMASRFIDQMRSLGLRPISFSKYCVGVALFYPTIKHNQFKPTLRCLDLLQKESMHTWTT